MKNILLVFVMIIQGLTLSAQDKVQKPKRVVILNDTIVAMQEIEEFIKNGQLKAMHNGVTQEERDFLHTKLGDIIGDREFIVKIELRTEEELAEQKRIKPKVIEGEKESENDFKLAQNDKSKDFTVKMINGEEITLTDLKGNVVLVNFWATWCAPCLQEFTETPEKILKPFVNKGFVFVPIAIGQKKEVVSQKMLEMNKYGVDFNVGYDTNSEIWNQYAKGSIPKNFLIDKNGVIRYTSTGYSEESLDNLVIEIEKLISE